MAKKLTPARAISQNLDVKLPTVQITQDMRNDVEALKEEFAQAMGRTVSIGDIVRWSVQSFIEKNKGR